MQLGRETASSIIFQLFDHQAQHTRCNSSIPVQEDYKRGTSEYSILLCCSCPTGVSTLPCMGGASCFREADVAIAHWQDAVVASLRFAREIIRRSSARRKSYRF